MNFLKKETSYENKVFYLIKKLDITTTIFDFYT